MKIKGFFSLRTLLLSLLILSSSNNQTALGMEKICSKSLQNESYGRSVTPIYSEDKGELLDLFGVVLRIDKDLANKEGKKIDPRFDAERTMRSQLWPKLDLGIVKAEDVAQDLSDVQDYFATLNFIQNIRKYIKTNHIGMEIFKAIKEANHNHKIHILSNLSKYCITGEYSESEEDGEYASIFNDGAVFSCTVGMAKPSKDIFEYAVKTFNLETQPVYFTDDSLANLKGARQAGLHPISVQCHSVWYFTCLLLGKISRNAKIEKLLYDSEPKEFEHFSSFNLKELQDFEKIAKDMQMIRSY